MPKYLTDLSPVIVSWGILLTGILMKLPTNVRKRAEKMYRGGIPILAKTKPMTFSSVMKKKKRRIRKKTIMNRRVRGLKNIGPSFWIVFSNASEDVSKILCHEFQERWHRNFEHPLQTLIKLKCLPDELSLWLKLGATERGV
jgi:hypothetical protein